MELSKVFGVREGQLFTTTNYEGYEFRIESCGGVEHIEYRQESGRWSAVNLMMMEILINLAPAGIIHIHPPLTDEVREELRGCVAIGYPWLAKDRDGKVYAYMSEPVRSSESWMPGGGAAFIAPGISITRLVSWDDCKPMNIIRRLNEPQCE